MKAPGAPDRYRAAVEAEPEAVSSDAVEEAEDDDESYVDDHVIPPNERPGDWFVDIGGVFQADPSYTRVMRNFNDYPNRPLNTDEKWDAELALALVNVVQKEVSLIGSLLWGFEIKNGDVLAGTGSPNAFGAASNNFSDTFLKDWPDRNDYSDWTIIGSALVPAPGALALLAMGAVAMVRRRAA